MVLDQGEPTDCDFPEVIKKKFAEAHIDDPYSYEETEKTPETLENSSDEEIPVKEYVLTRDRNALAVAESRAQYRDDSSYDSEERQAQVAGMLTDMEDEFIKKKRKGMTFIGKKQKAAFR